MASSPTAAKGAASPSILLTQYMSVVAPTDMLQPDLPPVLMGLFGEVGSLITTAKKHVRDADAYIGYQRAVYEEFGDTLWYLGALCRRLDFKLDELMSAATNGHNYSQIVAASDLPEGPIAHIAITNTVPILSEALLRLGEGAATLLSLRAGSTNARALMIEFIDCYLQAVQAAGVTLAGVIHGNIAKTRGIFVRPEFSSLPTFDSGFDEEERLPDHFEIKISQRKSGQSYLQWKGVFIGDPLTDNIRDPDGYRFHDVFHFAHAAILHWSPVFRALIKQKRKSDKRVDEAQDGGRAIVIEEGLTAWVFAQAKELNYFEGRTRLSPDLLKAVGEFVRGYEVEDCPLGLWEIAILTGFDVFRQVRAAQGGIIVGDRAARSLSYRSIEGGEA